MGLRIGPGPIFRIEARAIAGHRRLYTWRAALVTAWVVPLLVGAITLLVMMALEHAEVIPLATLHLIGTRAYQILAASQVTAALLIPPAVAADALGRERVKGLLGHLFATDLSSAEIVLGTYLVRLLPALMFMIAPIPIAMLTVMTFGTDPGAVWMLGAVSLGLAILGLALATAISLWTSRAYEALLGVYSIWIAWLVLPWFFGFPSGWSIAPQPYALAFGAYPIPPGRAAPMLADAAAFLAGTLPIAALALAIAIANLRRVALREPTPRRAEKRRWSPFGRLGAARRRIVARFAIGPALDGNPVLWREWWHGRRSRWLGAYWLLFAIGTAISMVLGLGALRGGQLMRPDLIGVAGFSAGFGLLAVAVKSASAWSEERGAGQGGLDALLVAPLSARTLVQGKWLACYRPVLWVAACPAIAAVTLAIEAPALPYEPPGYTSTTVRLPLRPAERIATAGIVIAQVLLFGAVVVSLGLWLGTRLRRATLSVIASVAIYIFTSLIMPILIESLLIHRISNRDFYNGLGTFSPITGPIVVQSSLFNPWFGSPNGVIPYALASLALAFAFAGFAYERTVRTFDRRMGRMAD
jgi:ABC-type transport system involved in multi-copper enzyme maturation permease subunit